MSAAALTTNSPYQRLLGAVDQLAATRAAYLAGTASYRQYSEATDAVARARDEAGVELTLTCLEDA